MRKAELSGGVVVNLIEIDPSNIPEWCADWPNADQSVDIGHAWDGTSFRPPAPDVDRVAKEVRALRDYYLRTYVDPYAGNFLRWADLHPLKQQEIIDYRSALLAVPQQVGFPLFVEWPAVPVI